MFSKVREGRAAWFVENVRKKVITTALLVYIYLCLCNLPWTDGLVYLVENLEREGLWFDGHPLLVGEPAVGQGLVHQLLSLPCTPDIR